MKLSRSFFHALVVLAALALSYPAVASDYTPWKTASPPQAQAKQMSEAAITNLGTTNFNYTLTKVEAPPFIAVCDNTGNGVTLGVAAKKCGVLLKADIGPSIGHPAFTAKFEPAWRQPAFALNTDVGDGVIRTFDNSSDTLRGTGKAFAIAAASRNWPVSLGFA